MPKVCARESCGKRLIRKDGTPDYNRHFCGSECKNADKRERIRAKRGQAKARPVSFVRTCHSNTHARCPCAASQGDLSARFNRCRGGC
jgi:hypothetical protein